MENKEAFILTAIVGLGMVCEIGLAADDTTPVTATMGAHIWISTSTSVSLTLSPETIATSLETVEVKTNKNQDWTVKASIDKAEGKLTSDTTPLSNSLHLIVLENNYGLLPTEILIYDDILFGTNHKTGGTPRDIPTTFSQYTTYDDGDGDYTGTITFTAAYKLPQSPPPAQPFP